MYGTVRVDFAEIPWSASNCYAAPNRRLWLVGPLCRDAKMGTPIPLGLASTRGLASHG
ncbi:MAG: hypothetical protein ACREOF_05725 [Gemmatimonadales bacterium]